jgi:3-dehydroquinate dehydratase-1
MHTGRPIVVRGRPIGGGKLPAVCTPLVGRSGDAILAELAAVLAKKPDLIEWRVDFFAGIADTAGAIDLARRIKTAAGETPLLFTRRSAAEGGEPIPLTEEDAVRLYEAVCESRCVDLVDFEMSNHLDHVHRVREVSRTHGVQMIASYHNFEKTPSLETLIRRFAQAEELGANASKVAVMPNSADDVLTLLSATLQSSRRLAIPLISMSMGGYGSLTRMFGWLFGSAVTFAVGESSSAPGQVPIEDLATVLAITRRATVGK